MFKLIGGAPWRLVVVSRVISLDICFNAGTVFKAHRTVRRTDGEEFFYCGKTVLICYVYIHDDRVSAAVRGRPYDG
jgi:hypothetical protein